MVDKLVQYAGFHENSKILEIGCGTGNYISALALQLDGACFGMDPVPEMVAHKSSTKGVCYAVGKAEDSPFNSSTFNFIFSVDVIHHIRDIKKHFEEAHRLLVNHGRTCTVTDSEEIIKNRQPVSKYWPGTVKVDLDRYPSEKDMRHYINSAGLRYVSAEVVTRKYELTQADFFKSRPFSCLHLISDAEFEEGFKRFESDLRSSPIPAEQKYICILAEKL